MMATPSCSAINRGNISVIITMDNKVEACSRQETIYFVKTFLVVFAPIFAALLIFHRLSPRGGFFRG